MKWNHWPTLDEEIKEKKQFLTGRVLNAGCGSRSVSLPHADSLINLDFIKGDNVDVVGSIEKMPFEDGEFDSILNIAVLEHVERPWIAVAEMGRVLKKGGRIVCCAPFFQPIHYVPTDYYRFTPDGLRFLFESSGFEVQKLEYTHSLFHILGWIGEDYFSEKGVVQKFLCSPFAFLFRFFTKHFKKFNVRSVPCVVTIVAKKL